MNCHQHSIDRSIATILDSEWFNERHANIQGAEYHRAVNFRIDDTKLESLEDSEILLVY